MIHCNSEFHAYALIRQIRVAVNRVFSFSNPILKFKNMYKADTFLKLYFTVVWLSLNSLKICDQVSYG